MGVHDLRGKMCPFAEYRTSGVPTYAYNQRPSPKRVNSSRQSEVSGATEPKTDSHPSEIASSHCVFCVEEADQSKSLSKDSKSSGYETAALSS